MRRINNRLRITLDWMDRNPGKSGALAGWLQQASSAGVALLMVPVLTRFLSPAHSGLWFSFQGMVAVAGLANFGIGQVISRQTAYCLGAQSRGATEDFLDFGSGADGVRSLNHHTIPVYWVVLGLALALGAGIFELAVPHTKLLEGDVASYRPIWYLMLGAGLALIVSTRFAAYLIGSGRTHVVKLMATSYSVAQGLGVMFAVWTWKSLLPMALVSLLTSTAYAAFLFGVSRRLVPGLGGRSGDGPRDRQVVGRMLRISFPLGIVNIGGYLFSNIQVPLIGSLLGPAVVTPYYLAQKLAQFVVLGCQQSLQPQLPRFTGLIARSEPGAARALVVRVMGYYGAFVVLAAVGFMIGAPYVLEFMAEGSAGLPFRVIGLMSVDLAVLAVTVALSHLVIASGRNPFVLPTLFGGISNLLLILFLVPRMGLVGLPLATLASGLVSSYAAGAYHGIRMIGELGRKSRPAGPEPVAP